MIILTACLQNRIHLSGIWRRTHRDWFLENWRKLRCKHCLSQEFARISHSDCLWRNSSGTPPVIDCFGPHRRHNYCNPYGQQSRLLRLEHQEIDEFLATSCSARPSTYPRLLWHHPVDSSTVAAFLEILIAWYEQRARFRKDIGDFWLGLEFQINSAQKYYG